MENPSPGELFEQTFEPATTELLVRSLRRAYETACEHHAPERGGNEATFGYGLYHYAVHELCREAERGSPQVDVQVTSKQPLFRLQIGVYELACHRVGLSERESIWTAFPKNEGAAISMVEEQFRMPLFGFGNAGAASARKLILAHLGNADEGMRAVYLCIPGKTDGGRITGWLFARPLFRADDKTITARPAMKQALLPEVVIEEPIVTRKSKRADEAALPPEVAIEEIVVTRKPKKNAHEATG